MGYVIGADGGTEGLRVRVYDGTGRALGSGVTPYETRFPAPARAEQDPEDWWRALGRSTRQALDEAAIDPADVDALALDTTCCTVVALDMDGRPLRPAILWMDVRADREAADVAATGDAALAINGAGSGPVSAEWMIPKALWLKRRERDTFAAAHTVCEYQDYMVMCLTGRRVGSLSNASARWHYRARDGGWPDGLLAALDLSELREKWPSELAACGEAVGPLTAQAADHLGLTPRTQVVQAGVDALIGVVGLGVHRPGELALVTGSSHLQYGMSDRSLQAPGLWGSYADALYPGVQILEGGQTSTGSIMQWLGRLTGGLDYDALNREAAALPPGSEGVLVQDHFQGNRTPHTDPLSRGAITGLTLAHTKAHLFRAVMEGVAFGTRAILDAMREGGFAPVEMVVGGGATASPLWMQIHADTSGLPVRVPASRDAPNLGGAILASVGAGLHGTVAEAIGAMVPPGHTIEPRKDEAERYAELYRGYAALYPALKGVTGAA